MLHKVTYDLISKKEIIFPNLGNFLNVNLEYASPNPTGPIHIGHCRGAIYGDILANLLTKVGYNILRENIILMMRVIKSQHYLNLHLLDISNHVVLKLKFLKDYIQGNI